MTNENLRSTFFKALVVMKPLKIAHVNAKYLNVKFDEIQVSAPIAMQEIKYIMRI